MRPLEEPPSRTAWYVDAELNGGHTVSETLAYLAWASDYEDELAQRRREPAGFVSGGQGGLLGRLFRRLGGR